MTWFLTILPINQEEVEVHKIQRLQCNGCGLNRASTHSPHNRMNKSVIIIILVLIIAIQAIHLAYASRYYKYQNQLDDTAGTPYSQYNSKTTDGTYTVAYVIIAAGFSALAYAFLAIAKATNNSLNPKIQYNLKLFVALFQFTLAVIFALDSSANISPKSSSATAVETETNYTNIYWLELSDAVITWVICVVGSTALLLADADKGEQGEQVEQNSGAIKA